MTNHRMAHRTLALLFIALLVGSCDRSKKADLRQSRDAVTALGRVTPGRAAISIAAQTGARISKLEVSDGSKVKEGDVLALLDTHPLRMMEREAAQVAVQEARDRLEKETAYLKAQVEESAEAVRLLEIAVERERKELTRVQSMKGAIEAKRFDDQQFAVDSREGELVKARATQRAAEAALERIPSLVAVKSAEAKLRIAEAQLELSIIRAPMAGEVLKIFTYPGERIGNDPILRMGNTDDMHVIAEVHETDIGMVRVGQRATITSDALPEPVGGTVEEIGALIYKNDVLDVDPRADKDRRIVEVRIKLDRSEAVSRLTHLEVTTRIDLHAKSASATAAK